MRNLVAVALIVLGAFHFSTTARADTNQNSGVVVLNYLAKDIKMVTFNHASDPQVVYKDFNEWAQGRNEKTYLVATQFMFAGNQWVLNVHYYTRPY